MKLSLLPGRQTTGYTTFGSIWSPAEIMENDFSLLNEENQNVEIQSRITARWPDGSVKWAAHTGNSESIGSKATLLAKRAPAAQNTISITKSDLHYSVKNRFLEFNIPCASSGTISLVENVKRNHNLLASRVYPVFYLEKVSKFENISLTETKFYEGYINSVILEESGPLECIFRFDGVHISSQDSTAKMPFTIRLFIDENSDTLRFSHTFFYDGNPQFDRLKGMGIQFEMPLVGHAYNHHIKFATDKGISFHEAAILLFSNQPKLGYDFLEKQMNGELEDYSQNEIISQAALDLPIWNNFTMVQDSAYHYHIKKQTKEECCFIDCLEGNRASGAVAVNSENGGIVLGIRDFWQKNPSGFSVTGLGTDVARCTAWFYSPESPAYDFKHYDTKSYQRTLYEGFPHVGANPCGIAVTSECSVQFTQSIPNDALLDSFAQTVQSPPVYVASPEYYHEKRAFGYWSLPDTSSQTSTLIEEQLEKAFTFYKNEVDARNWYGLFNYGDIMHTYDPVRHCWRYDMGGYAWQNTELIPTYWLWLYFMRTGREDVFALAEAMSRHTADVDCYHFGELKGIGSRHNVRHWGCSCKEPRVAMAGHHRPYYYLTGNCRIGDAMEDAADADFSMQNINEFVRSPGQDKDPVVMVRSGPDWSSFVSNWMTKYERSLDPSYRVKIEQGISDLYKTPYGLSSGPEFEYIAETGELIYHGEDDTAINMHLQICMGGPEIWMETADMLNSETLRNLLDAQGSFYFLTSEEKAKATNGEIVNRPYSYPYFAANIGAYSAWRNDNSELAQTVWTEMLDALFSPENMSGFSPTIYATQADGKPLSEIPWISTNFVSRWCLNAILCLEFIPSYLPKDLDSVKTLLKKIETSHNHRA